MVQARQAIGLWVAVTVFLSAISALSGHYADMTWDSLDYKKIKGAWSKSETSEVTVGGADSRRSDDDDGAAAAAADDVPARDDGGSKVPPQGVETLAGGKKTKTTKKKKKKQKKADDDDDDGVGPARDDGGSKAPPSFDLDHLPASTDGAKHVLLIVADDMGYNDVGYQSSDLSAATPALDALATRGARLSHYYTLPSCTPARAALFTAANAASVGMGFDGPGTYVIDSAYGLPLARTVLSEVFQRAGYATHMVGKWNLGHYEEAFLPHRRGFDSFVGYLGDQETYFTHEAYGTDPANGTTYCDLMRASATDGVAVGECYVDEYSTDLYARRLVELVAARARDAAASPLLLYFAAQAPHAPLEEPPPMNLTAPQATMLEALRATPERRTFAKMVMNLDNNVRKIVDALASGRMLQDSVVAFASDNGGCPRDGGSNWPLRGTKFSQFEGGVRVPAFLWSAALQNAATGGAYYAGLVHVSDWFPTLLTAAAVGAAPPVNADGVDQHAALLGNATAAPRDEVLVHLNKWTQGAAAAAEADFSATTAALRWRDYKLVLNEGPMSVVPPTANASDCACSLTLHEGTAALYDLGADANETADVKGAHPEVYAQMVAKLHAYFAAAPASAWRPEAKETAYANWRHADNFIVPWAGNSSYAPASA